MLNPKAVERLLIDDARLLARRDDSIDAELEAERQRCLELFYQWQDGVLDFQGLVPYLIKWLRKFSIED
jgi:hypothetical protein